MYSLFIAGLLIVLAGIFDAAQTIRRDLSTNSTIYKWMKTNKLKDWYIGGNIKYNPSFPSFPPLWYQADFWHTMKWGWMLSYAAAFATLISSVFNGWIAVGVWFGVFILVQGVHGETFRIFYGNIFRAGPTKQSIWQILSDFNPFKNSHARD